MGVVIAPGHARSRDRITTFRRHTNWRHRSDRYPHRMGHGPRARATVPFSTSTPAPIRHPRCPRDPSRVAADPGRRSRAQEPRHGQQADGLAGAGACGCAIGAIQIFTSAEDLEIGSPNRPRSGEAVASGSEPRREMDGLSQGEAAGVACSMGPHQDIEEPELHGRSPTVRPLTRAGRRERIGRPGAIGLERDRTTFRRPGSTSPRCRSGVPARALTWAPVDHLRPRR